MMTSKQQVTQMNHYWKDLNHPMVTDVEKKKNMDRRFGIKDIKVDSRGNIISFNKYKRGQFEDIDEALIAEAGDICSVDRGDLKSLTLSLPTTITNLSYLSFNSTNASKTV